MVKKVKFRYFLITIETKEIYIPCEICENCAIVVIVSIFVTGCFHLSQSRVDFDLDDVLDGKKM